jgi:uncharacterized protein
MEKILAFVAGDTGISLKQTSATIKLLDEGATIPFISRYRKEATGGLDETQIQAIATAYEKAQELEKRKKHITETIAAQDKLTPELEKKIAECFDAQTLEDIYLPFKPKRRTKAEIAREKGLEPLARIIMAQNSDDVKRSAMRFVNDNVADTDEAIEGAADIIAEWISENQGVRNTVRNMFSREATVTCKVAKGKEEEAANYQNYFDFSAPLKRCGSHRILAMRRGEREGLLRVDISIPEEKILDRLAERLVKNDTESAQVVEKALTDSYKRLIKPSIENEFASLSKAEADDQAISLFAQNARQLLFAPPLGRKRILAIDPGYRTGCKVVCLDEQGNLLHNDTIYPTPPKSETALAAKKITHLIEIYKIDAIALGNGTASRETEHFLSSLRYNRDVKVFVVSEDGASIYSASKLAREEFPDKDVTVRGAVSIGRRLLDPLAELVKIDPKSIGVGQYQHDVDQTKLKKSLEFTVESCVNSVGVNLNTASKELLTYVSGLGPQLAQNIVSYRADNGDFTTRKQLMKVPKLGPKAFEQCAGFLRIPDGENPLDNTAVHPENYRIVEQMAKDCKCTVTDLIKDKEKREKIDISRYVTAETGLPTLTDIMAELEKPGRDPRKGVAVMKFDENIKTFDDLTEGLVLKGIVTNITQFGVFVDIGIKENGLVHISELSDKFVSSASEVVKIHQQVTVKVKSIDRERRRIALTMKQIEQ